MTLSTTFDSDWQPSETINNQAAASEPVQIEVHDTLEAVASLESEWRALEEKMADGLGYFQTFDWCQNWCRYYLEGAAKDSRLRLQIVTFRCAGQLACVLPLVERKRAYGLTILQSLGNPMAQYSNLLLDVDALPVSKMRECWKTFSEQVTADAIIFDRFPKNSQMAEILDEPHIITQTDDISLIMYLEQIDEWDTFQASFKKSVRRGRRRRYKKIETELGEISLEVHFGGTDAYRNAIRQSLEFKRVWLKESGRNVSAFSGQHAADFLTSLEGDSASQKGAMSYVMTAGGKPIAIELGFLKNGHYYCFLGSFDWSMRSYSAGKVQMEQSLKWAIEHQISCIDFLGNYEAYQGDWSNSSADMLSYSAAKSIKGRLYSQLWEQRLKPGIKSTFRRLPPALRKRLIAGLPGR
ncbi:GNAT family N-acetyltransferase [Pararhizobium sp. IMCC21322]|uniref:GNAT family N-acetyltransferase n=1 Tax=Pararhizobium sp. IMCC21322 TaxID=3067903 RepID=UPI00274112F7|nr:GNAT family N-acetyltransferase [Pararhizobium sp. IMCC21322]